MTEELARTKWCPMARTSIYKEGQPTGASGNDSQETWASCNCIASDCMMWRRIENPECVPRGYCGLAGKL